MPNSPSLIRLCLNVLANCSNSSKSVISSISTLECARSWLAGIDPPIEFDPGEPSCTVEEEFFRVEGEAALFASRSALTVTEPGVLRDRGLDRNGSRVIPVGESSWSEIIEIWWWLLIDPRCDPFVDWWWCRSRHAFFTLIDEFEWLLLWLCCCWWWMWLSAISSSKVRFVGWS